MFQPRAVPYDVYCEGGIDASKRSALWIHLSGAVAKREQAGAGYYESLLRLVTSVSTPILSTSITHQTLTDTAHPTSQTPTEENKEQIEKDITRTGVDDVDQQLVLRNVLMAYSCRNSHVVGYCQVIGFAPLVMVAPHTPNLPSFVRVSLLQGMNFVARILIQVIKDEEWVFWVFASIVGGCPSSSSSASRYTPLPLHVSMCLACSHPPWGMPPFVAPCFRKHPCE